MITSGHLCSGYDGLGQGLALLRPHETLWHAEADPDMTATLAKHEPDVPNVGDLITAPWHLAPTPDVVTAGIPCQPISGAGKGLGEDDERYLWPYAVDIFRTVRPPFILLENVQRLTSMRLRDGSSMLGRWLADLRDLRYVVTWTVIGACAVGAPHHRHRFYAWCRYLPAGHVPGARRILTPCGAPRKGGRILLPTPNAREGGARGFPSAEHAARRAADPMRSTNLEDAIALLPTPRATDVGTPGRRSSDGWRPQLGQAVHALLPTPMAADAGRGSLSHVRGNPTLLGAVRPEVWGKYAEAVALWETIIGRPAPEPTEPGDRGGRRLAAALPEWMMGLPEGYLTGHLPRNAALKAAGNGAVPLQAAAAQRRLAEA